MYVSRLLYNETLHFKTKFEYEKSEEKKERERGEGR